MTTNIPQHPAYSCWFWFSLSCSIHINFKQSRTGSFQKSLVIYLLNLPTLKLPNLSKYRNIPFIYLFSLAHTGALFQISLQSEQLKTIRSIMFKCITIKSIDQSIWNEIWSSGCIKREVWCVGLQTGWLQVRTILDLDQDPFLNNGFSSRSDSDSKPVLLVLNLILIGKSRLDFETSMLRGLKSNSKISSNFFFLFS